MPEILAIAYGSFVGSSGPVRRCLLDHRLRGVARVDARAPEIQKPLHAVHVAGMRDRGVNHQVVVDELGRTRGVGEDAANRAGDQEDVLGTVRLEPVVHGRLIAQVELVAAWRREGW